MNPTEKFFLIYGIGIVLAIPLIMFYNKMYKHDKTPLKIALLSYVAVIAFFFATMDNLFGDDVDDEDFFAGL
jgi:hypothetical protein